MLKPAPVVVFYQETPIASVNEKAPNLERQLNYAARHNEVTVLTDLAKLGVRFNNRNANIYNILQAAAYSGSSEFLEKLIDMIEPKELPRLLNKPNHYGTTLLHSAAKKGHHKTIQQLLSRGADPKVMDAARKTPLDLAIQSKDSQSIQVLNNAKSVVTSDIVEISPTLDKTSRKRGRAESSTPRLSVIKISKGAKQLNPFAQPFIPVTPSHPQATPYAQDMFKVPSIDSFDVVMEEAVYNDNTPSSQETQTEKTTWFNIFTGNRHCPFPPINREQR